MTTSSLLVFVCCLVVYTAAQGSCAYDGSIHDFVGTDLSLRTYSGSADADKDASCAVQCNQLAGCQYWVRATDTTNCWLKYGFTGYAAASNRRGNFRSAVTSFNGGVFEVQNQLLGYYIMGPTVPSEGTLYMTWFQGLAAFGDPTREQFTFVYNSADSTYTLKITASNQFCLRWRTGVQTNPYSSTDANGSIFTSLVCSGDDAKWFITPTCASGNNYYQFKNKASSTCIAQVGGGNSLLFSMRACTDSATTFSVLPYAPTSTTLSGPSTSQFGTSVTFTATTIATGPAPTQGTVTFQDINTGTVLGTVSSVNGVATLTIFSLAVGNYSIKATYAATGYVNSTSSALAFAVTDPFVGSFFEISNLGYGLYVMSLANTQGLAQGSIYFTWYQGLSVFSDPPREQFAFTKNTDNSYTIKNQEPDNGGILYCINWQTGVHTNPYSSTNSLGAAIASTDCASDAAKWFFIPVSVNGGVHFQIKNKASGTCMYPVGNGNSLLWGFQACSTVQPANVFDIVPYVITSTTLSASASTGVFGTSVTFTATVAAQGFSVPTATVTFRDTTTSTIIGTATTVNGVATFSTFGLGVGSHSITATYNVTTPAYFQTSTSTAVPYSVTDRFVGAFFEIFNVGTTNWVMGVADWQNLTQGSTFFTWYQGQSDFDDYTREQFAFTRNSDGSYTLKNQEKDSAGNLYCMNWETGSHSNPYTSTDSLGAAISSSDCSSDAAKWFFVPVSVQGGIHWQIKNKASGTCMYPNGIHNSFLWGFQDCSSATATNSFDVYPYVVTTTTLTASPSTTATYGTSLTFTATVTAQGFPVPSATVTFHDSISSTDLATITTVNGVATWSTYSLAIGSYSITASYPLTSVSYLVPSSSSAVTFSVTDPFVNAFFEIFNVGTTNWVMSVADWQGLTQGTTFFTWYQGKSDFDDYTREQFAFTRNSDGSYTLKNQEKDSAGNLYCMNWETGSHSNPYTSTDSLGAAISSSDCSSDAAKWFFVPVSVQGGIHWQIKNKASGTCMYPNGIHNSFLWGFQDCSSATATNSFDVYPYVVTTVTLTASPAVTSAFGTIVTFTATVTAQGFPVPAATVTFHDDFTEVDLATSITDTDGIATWTTYTLPIGSYSLTATYPLISSWLIGSSSSELEYTVTDPFEVFYEIQNVGTQNWIMSVSDTQNLDEGSSFFTWYQGKSDFSEYKREQFLFTRNSDNSYTLQNQETDSTGTLYCMIWETGTHANEWSSTSELGTAISSENCSSDASKWFLNPVNLNGAIHWQLKNKQSGNCMYPVGVHNSFLFGFQDCSVVSDITLFDVVPYAYHPAT